MNRTVKIIIFATGCVCAVYLGLIVSQEVGYLHTKLAGSHDGEAKHLEIQWSGESARLSKLEALPAKGKEEKR